MARSGDPGGAGGDRGALGRRGGGYRPAGDRDGDAGQSAATGPGACRPSRPAAGGANARPAAAATGAATGGGAVRFVRFGWAGWVAWAGGVVRSAGAYHRVDRSRRDQAVVGTAVARSGAGARAGADHLGRLVTGLPGLQAAADPKALWYANRASGLVLLVLFTAAVLLGQASTARPGTWLPRFVSVELHRNTALLALALLAVHIGTGVADDFVDIVPLDTVLPFRSPYRPLWLGLGTLAFDLVLAVWLTTLGRRRLPARLWRAVHWLSYPGWTAAVLHGLGTGTDTRRPGTLLMTFGCVSLVVLGGLLRLAGNDRPRLVVRVPACLLLAATPLAVVVWLRAGPLQADWSRRAGTPPPAQVQAP